MNTKYENLLKVKEKRKQKKKTEVKTKGKQTNLPKKGKYKI